MSFPAPVPTGAGKLAQIATSGHDSRPQLYASGGCGRDMTLATTEDRSVTTFDLVWDVMAEQGKCDARGAAEYERVKREWMRAKYAEVLAAFILASANQPGVVQEIEKATFGGE